MKVALVGPNSSISLAIIPLFKKEDEIITLGRKNADIELDLQSIDVPIKLPENTEVIIHSAAHFGGSSLEDTCDAIKVNILGTLRLFDAAVLSNVRQFVYVSSLYSHLTYNSNLYSIYSLSKRCSEDILKLYSKGKKVKLLIIRPSQIYGNFYSMRKHQPFFYSIIDKIRKNEKVVFWGRRDPSRNFIHIDDLRVNLIALFPAIFLSSRLPRLQKQPLIVQVKYILTLPFLILKISILNLKHRFIQRLIFTQELRLKKE
jgi:nucleoside-diphosphate-sugar epimerase